MMMNDFNPQDREVLELIIDQLDVRNPFSVDIDKIINDMHFVAPDVEKYIREKWADYVGYCREEISKKNNFPEDLFNV